jgi:hypothetical protein
MKECEAELCGAVIGDGWIESRKTDFFLAGDPREDRDYYDMHVIEIFRRVLGVNPKPRHFPYWKVYGISLHRKALIEKLLELGLPSGKKAYSASIPDWIVNSGKETFFSFFRGLFDTDGCVSFEKNYTPYANEFTLKYHSRARVRINSVSPILINQTFNLLTKYGIKCTKRVRIGGFRNNRNNRDVHIIEINGKKSVKWLFEDLESANPKHVTKYLIWKKFGFCPPQTSIIDRKAMLKNKLSPYSFYKRGFRSGQTEQTQDLLA